MSRWGRWLLRLAAVLLLGAALGFSPPLSPESLPARWSNFAFWRESARTVWDRLLTAWTLPGLLPRYELWARYSLPALLCTAAACILVGAGAGLWTARPRRGERE